MTPFIVPHSGPGGWGDYKYKTEETKNIVNHLMLTGPNQHKCAQLAMHTHWGPVSAVCSRLHMHVPVRESVMHTDIALPCSPHHKASHTDLSVLYWLGHPMVMVRDGLQILAVR